MTAFKCGEAVLTMDHLLRCRILTKECNIWVLSAANDREDWVCMMLAADNLMFDDGLDKKNTYYANMQNNSSKSRGDFSAPRTRLRFTDKAFAVSAPSAWNSLPIDIRDCSSEATFTKHLKTFLFHGAFNLFYYFLLFFKFFLLILYVLCCTTLLNIGWVAP